ncbi:hypothetical protein GXW74_23655 [Roseomonas eburnea]|uniref:Uncharacterized protein n=1 Tax=Neoroseomonas eburnea TaxID=1346889 RepID=A0A9X9XIG5_9PROT|nr:hypothetical protein [Neoroseomonas eburnea]MBR0683501.1 hypothetical protein [Neoroseomonas eburnea]
MTFGIGEDSRSTRTGALRRARSVARPRVARATACREPVCCAAMTDHGIPAEIARRFAARGGVRRWN